MLRLLPADEAQDPEPPGEVASLLVQLTRPPQIAEQDRHPRQVCGRTNLFVGVRCSGDLDRLLEVADAARVAHHDPRDPDRVQVARSCRCESELFGEAVGLLGEHDRTVELVGHHQHPTELLEDERLRGRRAALGDELAPALEELQRPVRVAAVQPDAREARLGLRRGLDPPRADQALGGLEQDRVVEAGVVDAAPGVGEQELGPLLVLDRRQVERLFVQARRRGIRTQREGTVARVPRGGPRTRGQLLRLRGTGGASQPQRLEVVVGKHLGLVLRASEGLDPRRRALVPLRPGPARDLPVGDVADQQVPERVLLVAGDRRAALTQHELLTREGVQPLLAFAPLQPSDCARRAEPEDLPEDGRVL